MPSQTLRQYLTKPNPVFIPAETHPLPVPGSDGPRPGSRASTQNDKWPIPGDIVHWDDFNLQNLRQALGKRLETALGEKYADLRDYSHLPLALLRVSNEDSLTSVLVKSNQSIVLEALMKTSEKILEQKVEMVRGGQAILIYDLNHHSLPDWAGIRVVQRPNNILPGETKTSWSFSCAKMEEDNIDAKEQEEGHDQHSPHSHWPVRQLLYYCLCSYSRYGYIITDRELVAFRVGPRKAYQYAEEPIRRLKNRLSQDAIMEYRRIPWDDYGPYREFTVNLALWVLHILAANNGLLESKPYAPLGTDERILPEHQFNLPEMIPNKTVPASSVTKTGSNVRPVRLEDRSTSGVDLLGSQSQVSSAQHSQSETGDSGPLDSSDAGTVADTPADNDMLLTSGDFSNDRVDTADFARHREYSFGEKSPSESPSAVRSQARTSTVVSGIRKRKALRSSGVDFKGHESEPKSPKRGKRYSHRSNAKPTGGRN